METKLDAMRRVLKELETSYQNLTAYAGAVAEDLGFGDALVEDWGPFEVITKLRAQVRIGEEYTKPFTPKRMALRNPMLMSRTELDESV